MVSHRESIEKSHVQMTVKSFCQCKMLSNNSKIGIVFLSTVNNRREVEMHFRSFLFYSTAFPAFLTPARSLPFHS